MILFLIWGLCQATRTVNSGWSKTQIGFVGMSDVKTNISFLQNTQNTFQYMMTVLISALPLLSRIRVHPVCLNKNMQFKKIRVQISSQEFSVLHFIYARDIIGKYNSLLSFYHGSWSHQNMYFSGNWYVRKNLKPCIYS